MTEASPPERSDPPNPAAVQAWLRRSQVVAAASTAALLILCVLWEMRLAPLRPGGSWVALKALPLAFSLAGIVRGRLYTYQWTSLLVLGYFTEGAVRAWSEPHPVRALALTEVVLALAVFGACLAHAWFRRSPRAAA